MTLYYLFYLPFSLFVGHLPIKVQYWLADFIYIILYRLIRYRVKVVRENLKNSFADKSDKWRADIEKKFYHNLADNFIEMFAMTALSKEEGCKRMKFINADQVDDITEGSHLISSAAHFGNWEYTTVFASYIFKHTVSAVYHPLKSKSADKFFFKIREKQGVIPVPMQQTLRFLLTTSKEKKYTIIAFIADQNPPLFKNEEKQMWYDFLGRKTLFFNGIEKIALKMKVPVSFLHIDKVSRGHYIGWHEIIWDGKEPVESGEITRRYVERVEKMIVERPEMWLWSHKRWKHIYKGDE